MSNTYYNIYPQLPSAPPEQYYETNDIALERIKRQYEISPYFAKKLEKLRGIEIVLLCDDSGSMEQAGSFDKKLNRCLTRWEELKQRVVIIMEIAMIMDPDGIDIYFLNRNSVHNIKNVNQINNIFATPPCGGTPLTESLNKILIEKQHVINEKKVLIIIATDGEPRKYDRNGRDVDGREEFIQVLKNRKPIENIPISIMACTDDEKVMAFLNKVDKIPYIDVLDDYENEKEEILRAQGSNYIFGLGDYIVKTLVGPFDLELDNLDEKKYNCILL